MSGFVYIALCVAAVLAVAWYRSRRRGLLVLAISWGLYAAYEFLMAQRVLCSGECNIRVDLLLIIPALLGSTLWMAVAAAVRWLRRPRN